MESTRLAQVLQGLYHRQTPFIDLCDSDWHRHGWVPDPAPLREAFETYLATRCYSPDPQGSMALRESLVSYYHRSSSLQTVPLLTQPQDFLVTSGTSDSYRLLFRCLGTTGQSVLLPDPCYPLIEHIVADAGLVPVYYPLDPQKGWQPDLDVLDALIDATSAFVVLISPNNPTGSVISQDRFEGLLHLVANRGIHLIYDEVFDAFVYDQYQHSRAEQGINASVFILNGLSKLGLSPDLKVSWILGLGPDRCKHINELALLYDNYLSASPITQELGRAVLRHVPQCLAELQKSLAHNRDFLAHIAGRAGWKLSLPQGGIHWLLPTGRNRYPDDEALACRLLQRHGIHLQPASWYGSTRGLVGTLLGNTKDFAQGLSTLANALEEP